MNPFQAFLWVRREIRSTKLSTSYLQNGPAWWLQSDWDAVEANNRQWWDLNPVSVDYIVLLLVDLELDKLNRPEVKPSDLKNELAENIVRIGKEYVDDDEKYFPLSKIK